MIDTVSSIMSYGDILFVLSTMKCKISPHLNKKYEKAVIYIGKPVNMNIPIFNSFLWDFWMEFNVTKIDGSSVKLHF